MNPQAEKKYKQSRQRERILELLKSTTSHPTADWLYSKLKEEFPRLSVGTVYRNLAILKEQGLISELQFGSTFNRFEARVDPHYHLVCEKCGSIQDLDMPLEKSLNEKVGGLTDFRIKTHRVTFFGICKNCLSKTTGK
jgi:Fur family peroxide stress response transcriptional regulator